MCLILQTILDIDVITSLVNKKVGHAELLRFVSGLPLGKYLDQI